MKAYSIKTDFSDLLSFPAVNSDGCGFIVRLFSKELAGIPTAYFVSVGKHEWYIGSGRKAAFWGPEVFESVKARLLKDIDTYSIEETLNVKALTPIIEAIISNSKEVGEIRYDEALERLEEERAEYLAASFDWEPRESFSGSF